MRRIVYWSSGLLVLMAILGFLPCPASAKDTLIIGLQDDAASLDPAQTYETTAVGIITLA